MIRQGFHQYTDKSHAKEVVEALKPGGNRWLDEDKQNKT